MYLGASPIAISWMAGDMHKVALSENYALHMKLS